MIAYRAYDRERAVAYARRYAFSRNPLFYDFVGIGGDCTNFVSQSVLAGSCVMNTTPDFGWYYRSVNDRAPAWTGVDAFWRFMTEDPVFVAEGATTGPFGREVEQRGLEVGDVVQLGNSEGRFYHTLLVSGFDGEMPLLAAHTIDVLDRPLDDYSYTTARFLHLVAVRVPVDIPDCYPALIEGRALPMA
ncbi:MAG: amidase [Ruminococcaceae bacterium]|nr:amidase [Oscillospiraceae bacterium]